MTNNYTKKEEKKALEDIKKDIIKSFTKIYGFAPTAKSIIPMEGASYNNIYTYLAFTVKGIGYSYKLGEEVERATAYDL